MQSTKGHPSIFAGQFQTESVWIFWENSNLSFAFSISRAATPVIQLAIPHDESRWN